jgi:hypothetical protein
VQQAQNAFIVYYWLVDHYLPSITDAKRSNGDQVEPIDTLGEVESLGVSASLAKKGKKDTESDDEIARREFAHLYAFKLFLGTFQPSQKHVHCIL